MYFFSQGNPCNENRVPAMRTGLPCNENRFFPVRQSTQGKPCSGPVLALYGIAVKLKFHTSSAHNSRVQIIFATSVSVYLEFL